ncbi:MAG: cytochrome c family protein [Planctomycetota bacterium]
MTEEADRLEVRVTIREAPAELRLVWIGGTMSRLDSCACKQNVRFAHSAALLRRLAKGPPRTALIDAGGALDGDSPLDRERQRVYAAILKDLPFSAFAVGGGRGFLTADLQSSLAAAGPPLLTIGGLPVTLALGGRSLSVVCADSPPEPPPGMRVAPAGPKPPVWGHPDAAAQAAAAVAPLKGRGDLVVLTGDLSREDVARIAALPAPPDLVLTGRPLAASRLLTDERTRVVYEDPMEPVGPLLLFGTSSSSFGGIRYVDLGADGAPVAYGMFQIAQKIELDARTSDQVEAFMRRIAEDPSLAGPAPRRFASEPRENDPTDGYVGKDACLKCHEPQARQWSSTPHGSATKVLENMDRHYYPGCITCHSTGYGYPTGYSPRDANAAALRDVGCETCHGPGRRHSASPEEEGLIRRGSPSICAECHDGRDAKPLGDRLKEAYEKLRH